MRFIKLTRITSKGNRAVFVNIANASMFGDVIGHKENSWVSFPGKGDDDHEECFLETVEEIAALISGIG